MGHRIFLFLLYIYRGLSKSFHFLSHCFGVPSQCRYPISCSEFALIQLKTERNLFHALRRIALRLISCQPWFSFFYSPLPRGQINQRNEGV